MREREIEGERDMEGEKEGGREIEGGKEIEGEGGRWREQDRGREREGERHGGREIEGERERQREGGRERERTGEGERGQASQEGGRRNGDVLRHNAILSLSLSPQSEMMSAANEFPSRVLLLLPRGEVNKTLFISRLHLLSQRSQPAVFLLDKLPLPCPGAGSHCLPCTTNNNTPGVLAFNLSFVAAQR